MNQQSTQLLQQVSDLTLGQWRIVAIFGTGKAKTSKQIQDSIKMDPGLISRLLKQLETKEYIKTQRSQQDRRILDVKLTPKGIETFTKVFPIMEKRQKNLLQGFSEQEIHNLKELLDRVHQAISAD